MQLTIGFSPCPNDTFIFDAMIHGKIDTEGLSFNVIMGDVEELNNKAFRQTLDITKLSFNAFTKLANEYILLHAGSALGFGAGPLLIGKTQWKPTNLDHAKIAIPGFNTTANMLLSLAFPNAKNKVEMLFSDIEQTVIDGTVDLGLIIHENRFTYMDKGLVKNIDLGEWWEEKTQLPIPLGGIAIKRSISKEIQEKINRVLRKSVEYAFKNPEGTQQFVAAHAQEMNTDVMFQHIDLYVNDYSIDLGKLGRKAVEHLFQLAHKSNWIDEIPKEIFV